MRHILISLAFITMIFLCLFHTRVKPITSTFPIDAERIIHVHDCDQDDATLTAYEKQDNKWVQVFRTDAKVGYNGTTEHKSKVEGDGKTPTGTFKMFRAFGLAPEPQTSLEYTQLDEQFLWIDDPSSRYYNQFVTYRILDKDWSSAEHLALETIAYKYAIVIEYNTNPIVPGAGSAIFLHITDDNHPTNGRVSVSEPSMLWLLQFIKPNDLIIIE
ncbi:L,D-transpeptidase family protein [Lachnospiraceae bacterium OttesenSCG-928-E19]|nr:L,D-transpeptidase family protein [Lachnospiraceae bacterium OttesenSCG-928-E19]